MKRLSIPIRKIFGRWTVIKQVDRPAHIVGKNRFVLCECACGNQGIIKLGSLLLGDTESCGCLQRELITKHGMRYHPLYGVHCRMMDRCYNEDCDRYADWGGRGIRVCKSWHDIRNFIDWEENLPTMKRWRKGLTIERIDNEGNYKPSNCEFVTPEAQANNRRSSVYYESGGSRLTVTEIARNKNVNVHTLRARLRKGMSVNAAVAR